MIINSPHSTMEMLCFILCSRLFNGGNDLIEFLKWEAEYKWLACEERLLETLKLSFFVHWTPSLSKGLFFSTLDIRLGVLSVVEQVSQHHALCSTKGEIYKQKYMANRVAMWLLLFLIIRHHTSMREGFLWLCCLVWMGHFRCCRDELLSVIIGSKL